MRKVELKRPQSGDSLERGLIHPGARPPYLVPTRGWGVVVDTARASEFLAERLDGAKPFLCTSLEIHNGELLPGAVDHDKARLSFVDRPGREAANRHCPNIYGQELSDNAPLM